MRMSPVETHVHGHLKLSRHDTFEIMMPGRKFSVNCIIISMNNEGFEKMKEEWPEWENHIGSLEVGATYVISDYAAMQAKSLPDMMMMIRTRLVGELARELIHVESIRIHGLYDREGLL